MANGVRFRVLSLVVRGFKSLPLHLIFISSPSLKGLFYTCSIV